MPKKGSTFGGPAQAVEEDEDLSLEELNNVLGNPIHELAPVVRRRIDALANLQKEYLVQHKKYQTEVRELERKYQKVYDPIFDKREKIVNGTYEPTDAEAKVEKDEDEEEGVKPREAKPEDKDIKGIPHFWFTVLQNNVHVGQSIFEADEDALTFLRDIRYNELEGDEEGFVLTFLFAENPYFSNTTLTKTYHMESEELFGELLFDHATGTKIEWKAGKNLTVKQIKKKTKAKGKKPARVVTVEEPAESFFNFFSPPQPPKEEDEEGLDEEEGAMLEMDFDIGCIIKDKLIPFSVLWFTGEAAEYEDDDDMDDFADEDDDDEAGEEDDDEDDDDEEDEPPRRGGGGGGGKRHAGPGHSFAPPPGAKGGNAPGQPQQPECKQQ